jgi:hypothetical protein
MGKAEEKAVEARKALDDELAERKREAAAKVASPSRYKSLVVLAGEQEKGICLWLTNGQVLRGLVYDTDVQADWVRLFTYDGPHRGRGPMWVNQDHIIGMWWAPEDTPFPFDVAKEIDKDHEHEDEED